MCSVFMRTANTLIRLGGCPGSSESPLGVQVIFSVLCGGSFGIAKPYYIQFYGSNNRTFAHRRIFLLLRKILYVVILFLRYVD